MDEKKVIILDTDEQHCKALCTLLEAKRYQVVLMRSLDSIQEYIQKRTCLAVILDVDSASVDNRGLRQITVDNPEVYFFAMSRHSYNPEFKESICYHIYACLNKPIDQDEMFYWLKCIEENHAVSDNQTAP
ncbi:MAG: response regulator [Desulfobacterales bacterium]|nr:MAG: response regulator [Desulfobacterales bacterium]